jgi:hypothetical protein
LATASARVSTVTGSTDLNSSLANCATSRCWLPTEKLVWPAGSSLTIGHLGLVRTARQGQADEDRDDHRVGDQHHHEQRRAAQDLEVLEQQPAHQML